MMIAFIIVKSNGQLRKIVASISFSVMKDNLVRLGVSLRSGLIKGKAVKGSWDQVLSRGRLGN